MIIGICSKKDFHHCYPLINGLVFLLLIEENNMLLYE